MTNKIKNFIEEHFLEDRDQANAYLKALVAEAVAFFDPGCHDDVSKIEWLKKAGLYGSKHDDNYAAIHELDISDSELIDLIAEAPKFFSDHDFHGAKLKWQLMTGLDNEKYVLEENQLNNPECHDLVNRVHGYVVGACELLNDSTDLR